MSEKDEPRPIAENPSARALSDQLAFARLARSITKFVKQLGVSSNKLDAIYEASGRVLEQSDILTLADRFNDGFASQGWIATSSMSADTMRRAVELSEAGRMEEAEAEILAWFQEDTINLLAIHRAKRFNKAKNRWHQLREALKLTVEERYWSAVPLILIACDGFASDVLGTSPFEKDANLAVFDSIPGHPNSLPSLIQLFTKGVRKSSDGELELPLRHGILHGRSLGYANRLVCMKAWLLMIALVDWAYDKTSENERREAQLSRASIGMGELARQRRKLRDDQRTMYTFEPREELGPFNDDVEEDSPEFAIIQFLTHWKDGNFGKMAECAVDVTPLPMKQMAGVLRRNCELVQLADFEVRSVRQSTVARADAVANLQGITHNGQIEGEFRIVIFRHTDDGGVPMPTEPGRWLVQQNCILDLYHGRTIAQNEGKD